MSDVPTVSRIGKLPPSNPSMHSNQLLQVPTHLSPAVSTSPASEDIVLKPTPSGPKPCCVCKDEKALRDECFLLTLDAETKCLDKVAAYKVCMAGFGFKV